MPVHRAAVRPARVAFTNDIGQIGGIEMVLLSIVRHLPRDRYTPVYFAPETGPVSDQMRAAGIEVIPVPRPPWWSTSFHIRRRKILNPLAICYDSVLPFAYGRRLSRALRAARIDILHSSGMLALIAGGIAARLARIVHVAHIHDRIGSAAIRWAFQRSVERVADRIVAVSRSVAEGFTAAKTEVIPNAADLSRWTGTAALRAELRLRPDQHLIGMAGRLTPWKGQRIFLDAAARLVMTGSRADRFHFVIIGDDTVGHVPGYREELERTAARSPLQDRVTFLGRRADALDVMAACDVLVHASSKPEPFGLVIVEAMAVGTPVIATAIGGPLDIISDGQDGLLVPPADAGALARAISFLCDHPEHARSNAERAREKARTVYSPAVVTDRFTDLYTRLLLERRAGRRPLTGTK